jgi:hypothetical protein
MRSTAMTGRIPEATRFIGQIIMVMSKSGQVAIVSDHFIFHDQGVRRGIGGRTTFVLIYAMTTRIRYCVECPRCLTRYLIGFSPYPNGSYLVPLVQGFSEEWTLYCSCGQPPSSSRWSWSELKIYAVSTQAHDRGYGRPEEIVPLDRRSRPSG